MLKKVQKLQQIIWPLTLSLAAFLFLALVPYQPTRAATGYRLLKTAGNPDVYFVSERLAAKKLIASEAIFLSYGNKWSDIETVAAGELNSYPDIRLVKTAGDNKIYFLDNGEKRWIPSVDVFNALGFSWDRILTINQLELDSYPLGEDMSCAEIVSANSSVLNVSLAPTETFSASLPAGAWQELIAVRLSAAGQDNVSISELTFNLIGISGDSKVSLADVYLADQNGNKIYATANLHGRQVTFRLANQPLVIAAGSCRTIKVYGVSQFVGYYIGLALNQASDIATDSQVNADWPLESSLYHIIDNQGFLAQAQVAVATISASARQVIVGAENQIITKFKISETSQTNELLVKKIVLTKKGDLSDSNLKNIDLLSENGKVVATASSVQNGLVTFDLGVSPLKIKAGKDLTLTVRGDFVGGEGDHLQLVLNKAYDLTLTDSQYPYQVLAQAEYPVGLSGASTLNQIAMVGGRATSYAAYKKAGGDAISGGEGISLGKFAVKADGASLDFQGFDLQIKTNGSHYLIGDIIVKHNKEILAKYPAKDFNYHAFSLFFEKEVSIKAGQTYDFEIFGTLDDAANNLDSYQLLLTSFKALTPDKQEPGQSWQLLGDVIKVKTGQALASVNNKYEDTFTAIAGLSKKQLIGSFNLEVGAADNLILSGATIQDPTNTLSMANGYAKVYLAVNKSVVAQIVSPLSSPLVFNFKDKTLTKGKTYSLDVYADIGQEADGDNLTLQLTDLILQGKTYGSKAEVKGLGIAAQQVEVLASQMVITNNSESASATAGDKGVVLGSVSLFNSSAEKVTIKKMAVYQLPESDDLSLANGFKNLRWVLSDNHKKTVGRTVSKPSALGNEFGNITLKPFETLSLDLLADTTEAAAGQTISLTLQDFNLYGNDSKYNVKVNGDLFILGPVEFIVAE